MTAPGISSDPSTTFGHSHIIGNSMLDPVTLGALTQALGNAVPSSFQSHLALPTPTANPTMLWSQGGPSDRLQVAVRQPLDSDISNQLAAINNHTRQMIAACEARIEVLTTQTNAQAAELAELKANMATLLPTGPVGTAINATRTDARIKVSMLKTGK